MASLDYWRKFFRSANTHIVEVIQKAILVAATDCPNELSATRDQIAETLFTCLHTCHDGADKEVVEKLNNELVDDEFDELVRIKEVLVNHQNERDETLLGLLGRLQEVKLDLEILEGTGIGIAVVELKKHNCREIVDLSRRLLRTWKRLLPQRTDMQAATADTPPDSGTPSMIVDEDVSLPRSDEFPPLDEAAILATQTETYEISKFFEGMDEDGNIREGAETEKRNERTPQPENVNPVGKQQVGTDDKGHMRRRPKPLNIESKPRSFGANLGNNLETEKNNQRTSPLEKGNPARKQQVMSPEDKAQVRRQETSTRHPELLSVSRSPKLPSSSDQKNGPITNTASGRPSKLSVDSKSGSCGQNQLGIPKKPSTNLLDADEATVKAKLDVAKRKLKEGYREAENVKRQRTTRPMELSEIPKQVGNKRQLNVKTTIHTRSLLQGRR